MVACELLSVESNSLTRNQTPCTGCRESLPLSHQESPNKAVLFFFKKKGHMGFLHIFLDGNSRCRFPGIVLCYFVSKSDSKSNLYLHYQNNNHNPREQLLSELLPKTLLFCS